MSNIKFFQNITPEAVQFVNASGTNTGRMGKSGDNLTITNAVGDVLFGDGLSDVYIGNGISSVDLLFEQSGAISAASGSSITLTIGSADTTLALYAPTITNISTQASELTALMINGSNVVGTRELGTGAFGPTPVGAYLPLAGGTMTGNLKLNDNVQLQVGSSADLQILHASNSFLTNNTGDLYLRNLADDKDIIFQSDDGSGGVTTYLTLDGSTTHAYFSNPGNVGIGTTSPDFKLDVLGSGNVARFGDGTRFFRVYTDSDEVSLLADGSVPMKFYTGGAEKMRIASNGNVGIGTTSPSYRLEVEGGNGIFVSEPTAGVVLSADPNSGIFVIGDTDELGDGVYATNTGTSNFDIYSGGGIKFRMNAGGNVGIGTTSPGAKLNVAGDILINSGEYLSWGTVGSASIEGSTASNKLQFRTNSSDRMIIDSTGNVGIGTTSPTQKLDVNGSIAVEGEIVISSSTGFLDIGQTVATTVSKGLKFHTDETLAVTIDTSQNATFAGNVTLTKSLGDSVLTIEADTDNDNENDNPRIELKQDGGAVYSYYGINGDLNNTFVGALVNHTYLRASTGIQLVTSGSSTALTLDTSQNATFAGDITVSGGDITLGGTGRIQGVDTVSDSTDAANKAYVDAHDGGAGVYLPLAGGTLTGALAGTSASFTASVTASGNSNSFGNTTTAALTATSGTFTSSVTAAGNSNSFGNTTFAGDVTIPGNIFHTGDSDTYFGFHGNDLWRVVTSGSERLEVSNSGLKLGNTGATVSSILDQNDLGSDSDTALATQQSIKAYVDTQIATIPSGLNFQGNWNASTNSPTLASGTGTPGFYYNVSVAGSTNLDGETDWQVGDWAVFVEAGATDKWEKIDNTSALTGTGVAGRVAYWDSTNNLTQDSDLTFNGSSLVVGGTVTAQTGNSVQWAEAYNNQITAISDSGSSTITLTLTQEDGGTLTTSFSNPQGTVTKSGTPVNNQLAVWTSSTNIEGESELTYDGNTFSVGGSGNTTTYLDVIGTNTTGAPATAAAIRIYGYEGRGEGIFYYDDAYSTHEWYSGLPYSGGSTYQIGFHVGSQANYVANGVLRITSSGQVQFNKYGTTSPFTGTVTNFPAFTGDGQIIERTPAQVLSDIGAASSGSLGNYLPLAGGTMTGDFLVGGAITIEYGGDTVVEGGLEAQGGIEVTGDGSFTGTTTTLDLAVTGVASVDDGFTSMGGNTMDALSIDDISMTSTALNTAATLFVVNDSTSLKTRTAAEVLSDIGGAAASSYLPLSAGSAFPLTGNLFITDSLSAGTPLLDLHNSNNGSGATIRFSDQTSPAQYGDITYVHSDGASYGSGNAFILTSNQTNVTILADGKLMYNEGVYLKPATGTGAGTRKDNLWDSAYTKTNAFTTIGTNFTTIPNVSVASYTRINADETISLLSASQFASAIGVGNGTLTMTTSTGLDGSATFTANQSGTSLFAVTLDLSEITLSAGLDAGATSLSLDLSEFTDMTAAMNTNDEFIVLDSSAERRKRAGEIGLSIFNNDSGYYKSGDDIDVNQLSVSGESFFYDIVSVETTLDMTSSGKITNLLEPTDASDAATKYYVDNAAGGGANGTTAEGTSSNSNYFSKLATFTIASSASFADLRAAFTIIGEETSASAYAEISVMMRKGSSSATTLDAVNIAVLNNVTNGDIDSQISSNNFYLKYTSGATMAVDLYMKKNTTFGQFNIIETASNFDDWATTYYTNSAWISSLPSSTYTIQSKVTSGTFVTGNPRMNHFASPFGPTPVTPFPNWIPMAPNSVGNLVEKTSTAPNNFEQWQFQMPTDGVLQQITITNITRSFTNMRFRIFDQGTAGTTYPGTEVFTGTTFSASQNVMAVVPVNEIMEGGRVYAMSLDLNSSASPNNFRFSCLFAN